MLVHASLSIVPVLSLHVAYSKYSASQVSLFSAFSFVNTFSFVFLAPYLFVVHRPRSEQGVLLSFDAHSQQNISALGSGLFGLLV